ncbi:MAG: hypothetical protein ABXS93_07260 [Sulfurimonas sp.]
MKTIFVLFFGLFLLGCSKEGEVYIQDQKILDTPIKCMRLVVFPPNKEFETTLRSLYSFEQNCSYELVLSYKTGIVCNSNQNYAKKTAGLPSGYIRMEIKQEGHLAYTYYKDLKKTLDDEELLIGFKRIQEDLKL